MLGWMIEVTRMDKDRHEITRGMGATNVDISMWGQER